MCCVMPPASPLATRALRIFVEQRGLAMVDVAHDGYDRRSHLELGIAVANVFWSRGAASGSSSFAASGAASPRRESSQYRDRKHPDGDHLAHLHPMRS